MYFRLQLRCCRAWRRLAWLGVGRVGVGVRVGVRVWVRVGHDVDLLGPVEAAVEENDAVQNRKLHTRVHRTVCAPGSRCV